MSANKKMENGDDFNVDSIAEYVAKFLKENESPMGDLARYANKLADACNDLDRSWSGSDIGHHGLFYYGNFEKPHAGNHWSVEWGTIHGVPAGWEEKSVEEVRAAIQDRTGGIIYSDFHDDVKKLAKNADKLKFDVTIELSDAIFNDSTAKEKQLAQEIENFSFGEIGDLSAEYINSHHGGTRTTRDSDALMRGRTIPAHRTMNAGVYAARHILERVDVFLRLCDRFVKQMRKKKGQKPVSGLPLASGIMHIEKILNRFHWVAVQLLDRHDQERRPTLKIEDEYDVQDLLHALLTVDFDDIRAEDPVPQYAGSSSRIDLVFKKEGIVIETKMTSPKLKDKKLGEQLTLDIAHYKKYPGCKTLVCFIYDPGHYVSNRGGLIADLEGQGDVMKVRVLICP